MSFILPIEYKLIKREGVPEDIDFTPKKMTDGAVGYDLRACISHPIVFSQFERVIIPSGVAMIIPPGCEGQIRSRSGLANKRGLCLLGGSGTIDQDYRGEVFIGLISYGREQEIINPGDRIAQLIIAPVVNTVVWTERKEFDRTERNEGGFGSTGVA